MRGRPVVGLDQGGGPSPEPREGGLIRPILVFASFDPTSQPRVYVPITMRGYMNPGFQGFENRRSYWAYLFARL